MAPLPSSDGFQFTSGGASFPFSLSCLFVHIFLSFLLMYLPYALKGIYSPAPTLSSHPPRPFFSCKLPASPPPLCKSLPCVGRRPKKPFPGVFAHTWKTAPRLSVALSRAPAPTLLFQKCLLLPRLRFLPLTPGKICHPDPFMFFPSL